MNLNNKQVLIVGGGIAGVSAAMGLARLGIHVSLIEKADELGGHVRQFTCKATHKCEKCGACIIEEKIRDTLSHPNIKVYTGVRLSNIHRTDCFSATLVHKNGSKTALEADAVIIASGFNAFDPESKPYGYRQFDNVITNLELERMLRKERFLRRPSDNQGPDKIAFIQCVGSRDAKLNHLWCSKVCCGSALRMASVIKTKQPSVGIGFFYMDVQNFGKDFPAFLSNVQNEIQMIRAIPGDVYKTGDDRLIVNYFSPGAPEATEETFDMVILSVGITPGQDNKGLADMLNVGLDDSGFFRDSAESNENEDDNPAIFFTGTTKGPMSIADSIADAGRVVWDVVNHLEN